jgi:hypothetical protein
LPPLPHQHHAHRLSRTRSSNRSHLARPLSKHTYQISDCPLVFGVGFSRLGTHRCCHSGPAHPSSRSGRRTTESSGICANGCHVALRSASRREFGSSTSALAHRGAERAGAPRSRARGIGRAADASSTTSPATTPKTAS